MFQNGVNGIFFCCVLQFPVSLGLRAEPIQDMTVQHISSYKNKVLSEQVKSKLEKHYPKLWKRYTRGHML